MEVVDARRLRGPSLGARGPGAMVEVAFEQGDAPARVMRIWREELGLLDGLGWRDARRRVQVRRFPGGFAFHVPSTIDLLDVAVDVAEETVRRARERLVHRGSRARDVPRELLRRIRDEANPPLVALRREAAKRRVPFLFDDEHVTVGHAAHARTYALRAIQRSVPWRALRAVPVALVTGTNGKTTTTRLVARIAKCAGLVAGNTSSDGTVIDGQLVDPGDNTGGESARAVLRDPRVELAVLETARGGLLRRGLAVTDVDAALITNVSADHLGEHGVLDLKTLIALKSVVGHAVKRGGKLVLGADDAGLMRIRSFRAERVLFAIDPARVVRHVRRRGHAFVLEHGVLTHRHGRERVPLVPVGEVPITDGGRAVHNVKNALAAAALAWSLGLPLEAIRSGLRSFEASDNPGRGNIETSPRGVRVILDFGHNPAAAADLYAWARTLAGEGRVHAVLTQPGDRTDAAMAAFAAEVARAGVRSATVWETEKLYRGRAAGEIAARLSRALRKAGVRVASGATEEQAVRHALEAARPGDVVVVSPSLDREVPR